MNGQYMHCIAAIMTLIIQSRDPNYLIWYAGQKRKQALLLEQGTSFESML